MDEMMFDMIIMDDIMEIILQTFEHLLASPLFYACYLLYHAETMMLTFLLCHMLGVSSSCTNPVLYGFLNDNFVKAGANTEIHIQQFENPERILNPTKNTKVKNLSFGNCLKLFYTSQ